MLGSEPKLSWSVFSVKATLHCLSSVNLFESVFILILLVGVRVGEGGELRQSELLAT